MVVKSNMQERAAEALSNEFLKCSPVAAKNTSAEVE
jgi:hypothetical protein